MNKKQKWLFLFTPLFLFLILSCPNPSLEPIDTVLSPEIGFVKLSFAGEYISRTIMPETPSVTIFNGFKLKFYNSASGLTTVNRVKNTLSDPINLGIGKYELEVFAYLDEGRTKLAAWGKLSGNDEIVIIGGTGTSRVITLYAIDDIVNENIDDTDLRGIFRWEIYCNFNTAGVTATMAIKRRDATLPVVDRFLLDGTSSGVQTLINSVDLDIGYYEVIFRFEKSGVKPIIIRDILYIYSNLESNLTNLEITEDYFNNITYTVTFNLGYGDTSSYPTTSIIHGDASSILYMPAPDRAGYVFDGWYTNASYTHQWHADGICSICNNIVIGDFSLYAKWLRKLENAVITVTSSHTYNRLAQTPIFTVTHDGKTLIEYTDYTAGISNNINAGNSTAVIYIEAVDGSNNTGTKTGNFTIEPKNINDLTVTVDTISAQIYAGIAITPTVTVRDTSNTINRYTDYNIGYSSNINTGTATVTITGTGNYSGERNVSFSINKANLTSVSIIIATPIKNQTPATTVHEQGEEYTCGEVTWSPSDKPFLGGVAYTATVTLTAKSNYLFDNALIATTNQQNANINENTGSSVTLSHTFAATDTRTVADIAIKTQPAKLTYTHGDTLNLAGLEVTLTYDDLTYDDVGYDDFFEYNITANPDNGDKLSRSAHNTQRVTVCFGDDLNAKTNQLTVNPKALTIASATHTKPYDGTTTANGVTVTLNGIETADTANVSIGTVTAAYTGTNAGTTTITITAVTLNGSAAGNYTVTLPEMPITVAGITKITPSVLTWPTSSSITYGALLSTSTLTGGSGDGTFAWTNGATKPTVTNSGYSVTFTPRDTANYEWSGVTLTKTVSITVSRKAITITGVAATNRNYEAGNSTVALTGGTLQGIESGDTVGFTLGNGTMTNANVGNNKPVTTNIQLTGAASNNYTLTQPAGITVNILGQAPAISITFPQITGEPLNWSGNNYNAATNTITISRNGKNGIPSTLNLTLDTPSQYDNYNGGGIKWVLNPGNIVQTGASFTYTSPDSLDYTETEIYTLTLTVKKNNVPYNRTIRLEVTP